MKPIHELLAYGTKEHDHVRSMVRERIEMSKKKQSQRFAQWRRNEDLFLAYIRPDAKEAKRKQAWDEGKMDMRTIHIPYSYAIAMSIYTYWASVFLSRNPIFQFLARHGRPEMSVQGLEALVDYNVTQANMIPVMHGWIIDPLKYGIGVVCNYWDLQEADLSTVVRRPKVFAGVPIPGTEKEVIETSRTTLYEGNSLFNVRPYDFFPDPRVPLFDFQRGEFCARRCDVSMNYIMSRAGDKRNFDPNYDYFNTEQLRKMHYSGDLQREVGSARIDLPDTSTDQSFVEGSRGFVPLHEMVAEIIPKDVGLGTTSFPQKWVFTLAGNDIVIGCKPFGRAHNRFPFGIQVYEIDPYSSSPRGLMEILEPLNQSLSWLLQSHITNVRSILNGMFIVDPQRVNMRDFTDGGPGRLVRLAAGAYGTDVRTVITQFATQDVTQSHIGDMQILQDIIQRVSGANDAIQGMLSSRGRKTATEIRSSSSSGVNRLKVQAELNSAIGWAPLATMMVANLQQEYDQNEQFRIVGDLTAGKPIFTEPVTPASIAGNWDFVPVDGTMPIDRLAQANLWKEMIGQVLMIPQVAVGYDIAGIFAWVAKLAGLKNIDQFKLSAPDQLRQQVQAGNLVPASGPETGADYKAQGSVGGNSVRI